MMRPEGYIVNYKTMELATNLKFSYSIVDTPGGYPGVESEEKLCAIANLLNAL